MTPMRMVSLAPNALVEARAVRPLAMRKLRRLVWNDMALLFFIPVDITNENVSRGVNPGREKD
jgi:hypothetical protein